MYPTPEMLRKIEFSMYCGAWGFGFEKVNLTVGLDYFFKSQLNQLCSSSAISAIRL